MNRPLHARKSLRCAGYDYRLSGYYFVTLCTQSRLPLFGEIIEGHMYLNPAGQMIQTIWQSIPEHYAGWIADIWVVMPDHVHGILVHHCDTERTDTHMMARADTEIRADTGVGPYIGNISLPHLMRNIKSHTTFHYIRGVHEHRWPVFYKRLWQRGYHDHVIRHTNDLSRIRKYIVTIHHNQKDYWAGPVKNTSGNFPEKSTFSASVGEIPCFCAVSK